MARPPRVARPASTSGGTRRPPLQQQLVGVEQRADVLSRLERPEKEHAGDRLASSRLATVRAATMGAPGGQT